MSKKTKPTPVATPKLDALADALSDVPSHAHDEPPGSEEQPLHGHESDDAKHEGKHLAPAPLPPLPVEVAPTEPTTCTATKGDKACTLARGHAGQHFHVPGPDTIDAILSWA